jgi:hypothetical protein
MKTDLIAEAAATYYPNQQALQLAAATLSAGAIAERLAILDRRIAAISKTFRMLRYLAFFGIAVAFFILFANKAVNPNLDLASKVVLVGAMSLFAGGLGVLALCTVQTLTYYLWANKEEREQLRPIAGTIQCESALRALEHGGPGVTQWRDLALLERGQLHGFDGHLMDMLHGSYLNHKACAARQAEVDAACRKVHGLDPLGNG